MNGRKRLSLITVMVMVFILITASPAAAYRQLEIHLPLNEPAAVVNGREVNLEVPAQISNNRTMVPVSFLTQLMVIPVRWEGGARQVLIGAEEEIVLTIDAAEALVNGEVVALDAPAVIVDSRTLVPLSFVNRILGAETAWDADTRSVQVSYKPQMNLAVELFTLPVAGEVDVLASLDPQYGWDFALQLGEIGSYADGWGFRMGGTDAGREASMLVYDAFLDMGLEAELYPFELYGWNPLDASMTIAEMPELEIPVVPAPGPAGTDDSGITAELVYVGNATREELEGVDLTGKIALVAWNEDYVSWIAQVGHQVRRQGAIGALYFAEDVYGQDDSGEAFYVADWSGADIDIPVWNTPKRYGEMLAEILEEDALTVTLVSLVEIDENATGYNVVARIPGSVYPDEYVIINAHTDAYFQGFMDDSLPIGLMMTIAKAMADSGYEPQRTIVFVAHEAEEFGVMDTVYDWLMGSWALLEEKKDDWAGSTVACITLELLGYRGTQQLPMRSSDTLYFYLLGMTPGLSIEAFETPGVEIRNTVGTWSDEWSYSYHGIPTMRTHTDYQITYNFYHSQLDQADRVDYGKYVDNLNAYATLMMRYDQLPVMPYDLARTPQRYLETLNEDALEAQGLGADLAAAAAVYQEQANTLLDHQLALTALLMEQDELSEEAAAMLTELNEALRNVAKHVITEAQYLSQESLAHRVHFYQNQPGTFQQAIDYLEAGDGASVLSELGFPGKYYAQFYDYETWYNSYRAAIDSETMHNDL
ncbi:MAG: stalk domain-containing protein, partial [Bacillota bacterium]|nr:stalk domain-containing protein [Bacillota bacterium]